MERSPGRLQLLLAAEEIDRVVAVATVRRASTRRHEPSVAESPEVVRDQALRFADQLRQFPHGPVALDQLLQEPPPNPMADQSDEARRITTGSPVTREHRGMHLLNVPGIYQIQSN
jgi:hypothetical protein